MTKRKSPFLEKVRSAIRVKHYSYRTEQTYVAWIKRYIYFHKFRHPSEMREAEVIAFLTDFAVARQVAASTQNQALNALVFLYKVVLGVPLGELNSVVRAKKPQRLPVVLSVNEVKELLKNLEGRAWLIECLLYGSGLRLMEAIRLRVKDIEFDRRAIIVRDGKGKKDRVVTLADELITPLQRHLQAVLNVHSKDLRDGFGAVFLPYALARKYPNAPKEWGWQYVFPASRRSVDPRSGMTRRHHTDETAFQKGYQKFRPKSRHHKACQFTHAPPFLRDSSSGTRGGYPNGSIATWPQRHPNNPNLHPCITARRQCGHEPIIECAVGYSTQPHAFLTKNLGRIR